MQKITPFLWFNNNAEEAMQFYVSIFNNSKIVSLRRCGKEGPGPEGTVLTGIFQLEGLEFMALNGGPHFKFSEAISFQIHCDDQKEVDYFWQKLSQGGSEGPCGWLKDKFGLSWQIVPTILPELVGDPASPKSQRAMQAMLGHLTSTDNVDRYLATVEVENQRSIRLLERLGFHLMASQDLHNHQLSTTERMFVRSATAKERHDADDRLA